MLNHTKFTWKNDGNLLIVAGGGTAIAEVLPRDMKGEAEANAKLIAAAPDLLEALLVMKELSEREDDVFEDEFTAADEMLENALNKAIGG